MNEPPDDQEPEDNVPDAVADPTPYPGDPVYYRTDDGRSVAFLCGVCGGAVMSATAPDGWTHWSCPCARTCGMSAPHGALDLGLIRDEPEGENNLAMFAESFEGYMTVRRDKVTDLVRELGDTGVPDSEA